MSKANWEGSYGRALRNAAERLGCSLLAPQPKGPLEPCPLGTKRALRPVLDIHVGVITSSLGNHGGDACPDMETTTCISADFKRPISPCQFGGTPDCNNCGCIASAGLGAIARHRLPGGLRVGAIFENSLRVGKKVRQLRTA